MPNPRLYPASTGTPNEYEVIANAQIIGRITLLSGRSKPWFWALSLPFRGSRSHPWHGFEATRQAAMEVLDRNWHREQGGIAPAASGTGSTGMTGAQFEISIIVA